MKASLSAAACALVLSISPAISPVFAQQPGVPTPAKPAALPRPAAELSPSSAAEISPSTSPELWLYTQELKRHEDPQQAVRRKAEARADQRMARLATLKWFGQSNSRPQAAAVPFMDEYSPAWTGNGVHPFQWQGIQNTSRTVYVEQYYRR